MSTYRQALIKLLRPLKPQQGAEVGVHKGATSYWLLKSFPNLKLWMVDSWTTHSKTSAYWRCADPIARQTQQQMDDNKQQARERTAFAGTGAMIITLPSLEAAECFSDGHLDFVFLDASHAAEDVYADTCAWWPKVRPGGLFIWHDYDNHHSKSTAGVKDAVDRFASERGIEISTAPGFLAWAQAHALVTT